MEDDQTKKPTEQTETQIETFGQSEKQIETFANLQTMLKTMAEQIQKEHKTIEQTQRETFFKGIPETAQSVYIHLSHKISINHPYVNEIKNKYESDSILVTIAPPTSGQSFYDNHLDKTAAEEKSKKIIEPFENFSAKKSIDAIIYLCDYVCDGYQSPIFPDSVETRWHIWRPIELAEKLQKPLLIGYKNNFCFGVKCYEKEYITKKPLTQIIQI